MSHRQVIADHIPEDTTRTLTWQFLDEDGAGVVPDTILLTLYDAETRVIVNSRSAQNVKNLNGGTVDGSGNFTMELEAADTTLAHIASPKLYATRIALLKWTWGSGKAGTAEIELTIKNLALVP